MQLILTIHSLLACGTIHITTTGTKSIKIEGPHSGTQHLHIHHCENVKFQVTAETENCLLSNSPSVVGYSLLQCHACDRETGSWHSKFCDTFKLSATSAQHSISTQKTWNPCNSVARTSSKCSPVICGHNSITIHINNFVTALPPLPVQFCHNVLKGQWFNWFISLCYFHIWIYIQNKLHKHNFTWHLSPVTSLYTCCNASQLQWNINSYNWWSSSVAYSVFW